MNAMIVFLIAFVLVGVMPILTRAKGASMFMMLSVGKVLVTVAGDEVALAARMVLNSNLPVDEIASVVLMLLPAVLTLIVTKKSAKKRLPFHIVPSICGGLLAGYWSAELLGSADTFRSSTTYSYVRTNILVILLIGIVSTLLLMFIERPKPVKPEDQPHHGK